VLTVEATGVDAGDGRRPGPEAGDGPWTVEFAVEVMPLDA
jgi:hypothetical protein